MLEGRSTHARKLVGALRTSRIQKHYSPGSGQEVRQHLIVQFEGPARLPAGAEKWRCQGTSAHARSLAFNAVIERETCPSNEIDVVLFQAVFDMPTRGEAPRSQAEIFWRCSDRVVYGRRGAMVA